MWTDADFDEAIDEVFLGHHQMTPMGVGRPVPPEYFERFSGRIGRGILRGWERFGFEGFKGGRFWLTDPVEYAPVVEVWLQGLDLPFDDHWHCIAQTAIGMALSVPHWPCRYRCNQLRRRVCAPQEKSLRG